MIPTVFIPGSRQQLHRYTGAVFAAGGCPVCSTDPADARLCAGLLLPGGGDIYGTLCESEQQLIRSFLDSGRPVFGICRGMQALNVYFGGTLHRFIPGHQQPEGDLLHPTRARGAMARMLGPAPTVTSNHHQAVKQLGQGLTVLQHSADGVVEAIAHRQLPAWGVQYHPERQSFACRRRDAADCSPLFSFFLTQMR